MLFRCVSGSPLARRYRRPASLAQKSAARKPVDASSRGFCARFAAPYSPVSFCAVRPGPRCLRAVREGRLWRGRQDGAAARGPCRSLDRSTWRNLRRRFLAAFPSWRVAQAAAARGAGS